MLAKDWLILGKGPSFSKLHSFDTSRFHLLSLNHAVRETKVKIAHIIDFDVVVHLNDVLLNKAEVLVMPWYPHVNHRPSKNGLPAFVSQSPTLAKLSEQGRLLWYNLSTAPHSNEDCAKIIGVRYFSAEAALNLLATAGVKKIRTLGLDGGKQYNTKFSDLSDKTLLANGRSSFDEQFREFSRILQNHQLDLAPLDVQSPVKIFIGGSPQLQIASKVLEFSLRRHASLTIEVTPLFTENFASSQATGIEPVKRPIVVSKQEEHASLETRQRLQIPASCSYQGRAIYLHASMLACDDVRKLWSFEFSDAKSLSSLVNDSSQRMTCFEVMLINCSKFNDISSELQKELPQHSVDSLKSEETLLKYFAPQKIIPRQWCSSEHFEDSETSLLYFSNPTQQPWVSRDNPLAYLWCRELISAVGSGFISLELLRQNIELGWIRPSLIAQIIEGKENPKKLTRAAKALDKDFPPSLVKNEGDSPKAEEGGAKFRWRYHLSKMLHRLLE